MSSKFLGYLSVFQAEMEKEGAITKENKDNSGKRNSIEKLGIVEGKKCRAPHQHQWGHVAYHNAMICSVLEDEEDVKVSFIVISYQIIQKLSFR